MYLHKIMIFMIMVLDRKNIYIQKKHRKISNIRRIKSQT